MYSVMGRGEVKWMRKPRYAEKNGGSGMFWKKVSMMGNRDSVFPEGKAKCFCTLDIRNEQLTSLFPFEPVSNPYVYCFPERCLAIQLPHPQSAGERTRSFFTN